MSSSALNDSHVASSHDTSDLEEETNSHVGTEDEEIEEIKTRMREMEEEAEKLKQMQDDINSQVPSVNQNEPSSLTPEEKAEIDSRSIYVGNVDYSATADDLENHFHGCGSINRVTILTNKYTGLPKGFAYIEFAEKDSVETATALDESLFKGRQIKVNAKRTNRPGLSTTNRPPRGRGIRGRGFMGRGGQYPWYHPRGGRRPYRSRGYYGYSPY